MADPLDRKRHSALPFVMFLAWLVWLPLPLGSNRPVWLALAVAWLCATLIVILFKWLRRRFHLPRAFREAKTAWVVLFVFLLWQFLQLTAPAWMIPGFIHDAYQAARSSAPGITPDRYAGFEAMLVSIVVYGGFVCTLLLVDSMYRVKQLLWTLVWVGVVMSVITGITVMDGSQVQVLGVQLTSNGTASGSFINRNHFANYLVMTLAAGIGLLMSMQDTRRGLSWRQRVQRMAETLLGPKARLRVFLALMVITLVLTRSRMGNSAFFLSLLVAGLITLVLIRGRQRSLFILISSLVAIDIFIVGTWFGVEQVVDRIQATVSVEQDQVVINAQDRLDAITETTRMIRQAPLVGSGGGGYFARFPQFRSQDQKFMDHAHNDYLEFTANYGIPAMLLWAWFLFLSLAKSLEQLKKRNHPLALGASFTSLMAMIGMGIHSTVDFSLQIPANAVTFMVLLALPWVVSVSRKLV
ncbi:MAG: O-antigen ligase family protein [Xanthomonadales bacterium]|nr:O-antigen ligase family protein [Xanthomonadales bacterium]